MKFIPSGHPIENRGLPHPQPALSEVEGRSSKGGMKQRNARTQPSTRRVNECNGDLSLVTNLRGWFQLNVECSSFSGVKA